MIVVSDTSPLTNLAAIGQFGLLRQHLCAGCWESGGPGAMLSNDVEEVA